MNLKKGRINGMEGVQNCWGLKSCAQAARFQDVLLQDFLEIV